jgi:hypothetical protein
MQYAPEPPEVVACVREAACELKARREETAQAVAKRLGVAPPART